MLRWCSPTTISYPMTRLINHCTFLAQSMKPPTIVQFIKKKVPEINRLVWTECLLQVWSTCNINKVLHTFVFYFWESTNTISVVRDLYHNLHLVSTISRLNNFLCGASYRFRTLLIKTECKCHGPSPSTLAFSSYLPTFLCSLWTIGNCTSSKTSRCKRVIRKINCFYTFFLIWLL